jgi:glycosyltransferase involved in cell wall biosynthesis
MKIAEVYPHAVIPLPEVRVFDALAIVNYEIARRLARDHSVIVYSRRAGAHRAVETHEGVTWCGVSLRLDLALNSLKVLDRLGIFPPARPYRLTRLYYANFASTVARDVRKRECQIAHVHSIANFVPVIRRANPQARVVLHMHDHSLADFDERILRQRLQPAALVLGCSDLITNEIRSRFPEIAERCQTLHNGVDQRFLDIRSDPARSQTVLFVGRMSPEKGVHVLLESFRGISQSFPNAELRLVGPHDIAPKQFVDPFRRDRTIRALEPFYTGQRTYAELLKRQAVEIGGDRVRCEGPLPNSDVVSAYARAGIFVFPSVWHEPFGIPLIEAMAAGLPVITTRGGASSEIVVDGETGILVERGDAGSLAAAIRTLLSKPALRARMGEAGRDRAARLFTWDRAVARLVGLYENVLGAGPADTKHMHTANAA